MNWFTVTRDVSGGQVLLRFLREFRSQANTNKWSAQFLADLSRPSGVIATFFDEMFDARGNRGTFYGRSWAEVSRRWQLYKLRRWNEGRIGHRRKALRFSLASPGSAANIRRVSGGKLVYGSRIKYAGYFNAKRPVIDDVTMQELLHYMMEGPGKAQTLRLMLRLKMQMLQAAFARSGGLR